jgi:hypothetical protein
MAGAGQRFYRQGRGRGGVGCHVAGGEWWAAYLRRDRRSKEDHTLLIVAWSHPSIGVWKPRIA